MAREIKFRAWCSIKKTMMYPEMTRIQKQKWDAIHTNNGHGLIFIDSDNGELMQYTGLKDKNRKEIYEGDVNQDGGVVIWNKDDASFCWDYTGIETQPMGDEGTWCEIIGNIYQNQELLTK